MTCPSVRLNSEDTWRKPPGTEDDLRRPNFPKFPRIPVPDSGPEDYRPIPPELEPAPWPDVPGDDPEPEYDPERDPLGPYEPYREPPREPPGSPGEPPGEPGGGDEPGEPPLETPDGIDLEQFERGFEDNDDFFHEDYDSPDDEEPRLTPQTQEQESGQNVRLYNLWFKDQGLDLQRGRLPGLSVNTSGLLSPQLRSMLDARLLMEYQEAERYYANLYAKVFVLRNSGVSATDSEPYTPRVREQESRGGLSEGDLQTAAGLAITGIGIAASLGFLYRSRSGNARANIGGILSLEQY